MSIKKTYLAKKIINNIENIYSPNNGELIKTRESIKYIDYNTNFTKFFHFDMKKIKLTKGGLELLFIILNTLDYNNQIFLEKLKKNWTKSHIGLKKSIGELKQHNIIKYTEIRGFYILNPEYAYRGESKNYRQLQNIF